MKKQVLILSGCLALAALLGGLLIYLLALEPVNKPDETPSAETPATLSEKTAYEVDYIDIKNSAGSFTVKNLGEDKYEIAGITGVALNQPSLMGLSNAFGRIEAIDTVLKPTGNLSDYGLSTPAATATVRYTDGSELSLALGGESPGGKGYYGQVAGADTIYLFDKNAYSGVFNDRLKFVSLAVTEAPPANEDGSAVPLTEITLGGSGRRGEVVAIKLDSSDGSEKAQYFGNSYTMYSPAQRPVDSEVSAGVLPGVLGITAESVVAYEPSPELIESHIPAEPYATIDFSYMEGESRRDVALIMSEPDAGGLAYLVREGVPLLYLVNVASLAFYDMPYTEMLSKTVLMPFIEELSAVTIKSASGEHKFNLSGEGDGLSITNEGAPVETQRFKDFYQGIVSISTEDNSKTTLPAGASPALTITYEYRDKAKAADTVTIVPGSLRRIFITLNGTALGETRESVLNDINDNLQKLLSGEGDIKLPY